MIDLTPRQADALNWIRVALTTGQMPLTCVELGDLMGISKVAAWEHMNNLVRKSHLVRHGTGNRNLRLPGCCPHCGGSDGAVRVTVTKSDYINKGTP